MILLPIIAVAYDAFRLTRHFHRKTNLKNVVKKDLRSSGKSKKRKGSKTDTNQVIRKNMLLALTNIIPIITSIILFSKIFLPQPQIITTFPKQNETWESYGKPISITFDKPIDKKKLVFNISPEVEGEIKFKSFIPFLDLPRTVEFYPKKSFMPEEKIMVYISHISNLANPNPGHEYLLEFYSPPLPKIENVSIEGKIENIPVTQSIIVEYSQSGLNSDWEVIVEPEIVTNLIYNEELNSFEIQFPEMLAQSTTYTLEIYQIPQIYDIKTGEVSEQLEKRLVKKYTFMTVKAPLISSTKPTGNNVLPNENIVINFDQPMKTDVVLNLLKIEPEINSEYTWNEENTELTISTDLQKDTEYSVTIQKGTESLAGGVVEEDFIYKFKTIGAVKVISVDPGSGSNGIPITKAITLKFDQPIDIESAKSKFHLYPANNPSQQIVGNLSGTQYSLTFSPGTSYDYSTKYQIKLDKGVNSIYGLNSVTDFYYEFTTATQISKIDIVWDGQDVRYTCNFAAAKMALSAKGVHVSETDLINLVGHEPDFNFTTMSGGNPHKGFVNYYGTYWEPMSKAVSNYRQNMVKSGWTLAEACAETAKGNPIVTWGQNGWTTDTPRNWTATDGTYITGFSGMHSVVIVGCEGNPNNPANIFIQDPWRKWGNKVTAAEMLRRWSYFGNTGMVVY